MCWIRIWVGVVQKGQITSETTVYISNVALRSSFHLKFHHSEMNGVWLNVKILQSMVEKTFRSMFSFQIHRDLFCRYLFWDGMLGFELGLTCWHFAFYHSILCWALLQRSLWWFSCWLKYFFDIFCSWRENDTIVRRISVHFLTCWHFAFYHSISC